MFESMKSGVAVYSAVDNGEDFVFKDFNKAAEEIEHIKKRKKFWENVLRRFSQVLKITEYLIFSIAFGGQVKRNILSQIFIEMTAIPVPGVKLGFTNCRVVKSWQFITT